MDGALFTLGGREFVVPRLRVGSYKRALRATEEMAKADTKDPEFMQKRIDAYVPLMLEILRPNYPDLTLEQLEDLVTLNGMEGEFSDLLTAASALRKAAPPGEAVGP